MISRRSVRIKAAQLLYSFQMQENSDIKAMEKVFFASIEKAIDLNLVVLLYIREIFNYATEHHAREQSKHTHHQSVDLAILETAFMKYLNENEEFERNLKKHKTASKMHVELARKMYFEAIEMPEYKSFVANPSEEAAYDFYKKFFSKVLFCNEALTESLEDSYENVEEDLDLAHFAIKKTLKKNLEKSDFTLSLGHYEWKKETPFAIDLIKVYLANSEDYDEMIKPNLKGWDLTRIPSIQLIIIKLALCELLQFETIPIKVTLNEYIDLVKIFCDQKAKLFVNGILDRMSKDLIDAGKIIKTGRGLA